MPSELLHDSSDAVLATDLRWARNVWERARGLIGRRLDPGSALIIVPARQIHTFGLRDPIDVLFCDRDWSIVYARRRIPPARVSKWVRSARYVVELPAGTIPDHVSVGDRLRVVA